LFGCFAVLIFRVRDEVIRYRGLKVNCFAAASYLYKYNSALNRARSTPQTLGGARLPAIRKRNDITLFTREITTTTIMMMMMTK
jgi:hypothetical protein